jgi:hypothetical protein
MTEPAPAPAVTPARRQFRAIVAVSAAEAVRAGVSREELAEDLRTYAEHITKTPEGNTT